MEPELRKQIEEAVGTAYERYCQRHPTIGQALANSRVQLISATVESIEDDPEVTAALKIAETETGLQKIVEVAERYLPKLIGLFL